jgi:hypothetical protein
MSDKPLQTAVAYLKDHTLNDTHVLIGNAYEALEMLEKALAEREAQVRAEERDAAKAAIEFARWAIKEGPWNGCSLDGFEIQEKAVEFGLVEKKIANELNGDEWQHIDGVEEIGDDYYTFSPLLATYNDNRKG